MGKVGIASVRYVVQEKTNYSEYMQPMNTQLNFEIRRKNRNMEEINEGNYVRTKDGAIGKIIKCNSIYFILDTDKDNIAHEQDEIIKSSPNIIDLLEVGDYVNGSEVLDVMENLKTGKVHLEMTANYTNEELGDCTIYDKDIKSIVTKEQFESIKYEVNYENK